MAHARDTKFLEDNQRNSHGLEWSAVAHATASNAAGRPDRITLVAEFRIELVHNLVAVYSLALFMAVYSRLVMKVFLLTLPMACNLGITCIGLSFFALGLRHGLMPLGELVGGQLPRKASKLMVVLAVFSLGVLCTIAEPAIGVLRKAGEGTNREKAPLLAKLLDNPFMLMVGVGIGVGFGAMSGCVRLLFEVGVKPCLFGSCLMAMLVTLICVFSGGALPVVTGLAWDCGAVSTGPVIVPIVLALGIGVAASTKVTGVDRPLPHPQCGLYEVKLERIRSFSMILELDQPRSNILACASREGGRPQADTAQSALAQAVHQGASADVGNSNGSTAGSSRRPTEEEGLEDLSGFGIVNLASILPVMSVWLLSLLLGGNSVQYELYLPGDGDGHEGGYLSRWQRTVTSGLVTSRSIFPRVGFLLLLQFGLVRERIPNGKGMARALGFCYVGLFLFSFGLEGGLVPLGHGAGTALPQCVELYGAVWGPALMAVCGSLAGFIATFAEPTLMALGATIETITKGEVKKSILVVAIACGSGSGIALGMMKVYFGIPLWILLSIGYSLALALTTLSDNMVACIAWDAAGVTTGAVTDPIVLASGLALGAGANAPEGFGILACAGMGPILAVLIVGLIRPTRRGRDAQVDHAGTEMANRS